MLTDDDKDGIFSKMLADIMKDVGASDAEDRFAPKEDMSKMSPDEGMMDDGETPAVSGVIIEKDMTPSGKVSLDSLIGKDDEDMPMSDEDDDEEEDGKSPFTRDYFNRK